MNFDSRCLYIEIVIGFCILAETFLIYANNFCFLFSKNFS